MSIDFSDLAERIEAIRLQDDTGTYTGFQGFGIKDIVFVLADGWAFDDAVPEVERRKIAHDALVATAKLQGSINAERLKAALKRAQAKFLALPLRPYVLATSLLLRWHTNLPNARIHGSTVTFTPRLPKRFDRSLLDHHVHSRFAKDDSGFIKVRVHVRSRSPQAAVDVAADSLDLLRAFWNLGLNWNKGPYEWNVDQTKPINRVLPGPVQTLHLPNGSPAISDMFWYEPFLAETQPINLTHSKIENMTEQGRHIRGLSRGHPLQDDIEAALIRYCRATDLRDPQLVFVKLWGLIEFLTSSSTFKEAVRRVAFLFDDKDHHRRVLEVLRNHRNRSVHRGSDSLSREDAVRIHWYTTRLLSFALGPGRFFQSVAEMGQFLSLPADSPQLFRKSELLAEAMRFRRVK